MSPWSLSQFVSSRLKEGCIWVVAEGADNVLQGFALCQCLADEATLMNIGVTRSWQGRGLGRALLKDVIDRLRAQHIARLLLEVRVGNQAAISLYQYFGFIDDGLRKGYYPAANGREDALLMSLDLAVAEPTNSKRESNT